MYELLQRLVRKTDKNPWAPGDEIAFDVGPRCWTSRCLLVESVNEAPMHISFIKELEQMFKFGPELDGEMHAVRVRKGYVDRLRNWLITELDANLDSIDHKQPKYYWRREERIRRIGLPMHLRILRDTTHDSPAKPQWKSEGRQIASAWGFVDLSDAAWLWRHLFEPESAKTKLKASTRTIATDDRDSSRGAQGFSSALTVATTSWSDDDTPKHGFVPHPSSFGYLLDDHFRGAMFACHQYLTNIGLWPAGMVLEWNLKMERRTPILEGGSAGAAFALAAGSLLARLQQKKHASA